MLPKPYTQAASADLGGVRQPVDLREGGAARPRRAVLQPRLAEGLRAADQGLQGQHQARRAGRRLRERQRRLRHRAGLPWRTARPRATSRSSMGSGYHTSLVFRYLDTFPRPAGVPAVAAAHPRADARAARGAHRDRPAHRRRPRRVRRAVQQYADVGCDQIIFGVLASTPAAGGRARTRSSCSGTHVIPRFDKDPVHSTTRMREAALQGGAGAAARELAPSAPRCQIVPAGHARLRHAAAGRGAEHDVRRSRGRPTPGRRSSCASPRPATRNGFFYVAVCDHVCVPRAHAAAMSTVWYDTVATLGFLAAATRTVRLLSYV